VIYRRYQPAGAVPASKEHKTAHNGCTGLQDAAASRTVVQMTSQHHSPDRGKTAARGKTLQRNKQSHCKVPVVDHGISSRKTNKNGQRTKCGREPADYDEEDSELEDDVFEQCEA
jgi:hypothetical protein